MAKSLLTRPPRTEDIYQGLNQCSTSKVLWQVGWLEVLSRFSITIIGLTGFRSYIELVPTDWSPITGLLWSGNIWQLVHGPEDLWRVFNGQNKFNLSFNLYLWPEVLLQDFHKKKTFHGWTGYPGLQWRRFDCLHGAEDLFQVFINLW